MPQNRNNASKHVLDLKKVKLKKQKHRPTTSADVLADYAQGADEWLTRVRSKHLKGAKKILSNDKLETPKRKQNRYKSIEWSKPPKPVKRKSSSVNLLTDQYRQSERKNDGENILTPIRNINTLLVIAVRISRIILAIFQRKKSKQISYKNTSFAYQQLVWFIIASLIIVGPVQAYQYFLDLKDEKIQIEYDAAEGLNKLQEAEQSLTRFDLSGAQKEFRGARDAFRRAQDKFQNIAVVSRSIGKVSSQVRNGEVLLEVGKLSSEAGHYLTQGLELAISDPPNGYKGDKKDESSITNKLSYFINGIQLARSRFERIKELVNSIDSNDVPKEYRDQFEALKTSIPLLRGSLNKFSIVSEYFLKIFGHFSPKRYLVVFQNNAELRPSGGFMGSLAVIDVDNGKITQIDIPGGGPYDFKGQQTARVAAPEALWLIQPIWQFQDANWWPDWPASAQKIMWFYEYAGGSYVDGVWAITPDVIEDLLDVTGPIDMPEYGVALSAENFREVVQKEVEVDYDRTENRPKKIIADATPKLLDRVFSLYGPEWLDIMMRLQSHLAQRNFLLYFTDNSLQDQTVELGWAGEVKTTSKDYLLVAEANIAGGKTDFSISRTLEHNTKVLPNGKMQDTVILTRQHNGNSEDKFTNNTNNAFIRFYVPAGSAIVDARGFGAPAPEHFKTPPQNFAFDEDLKRIRGKIRYSKEFQIIQSNEFGKTVFGGWQVLKPGETKSVIITYMLPWKIGYQARDIMEKSLNALGLLEHSGGYGILVQKQSGLNNVRLNKSISWPEEWQVVWQSPDDAEINRTSQYVRWKTDLSVDRRFGAVFVK